MIFSKKYKSILCLDGELPAAHFFDAGLPIIAADGAANSLMTIGVRPHIVIGDLDAISPKYREQLHTHFHYDQNYCDYEKALMYMEENNLLPAIIVGISGGELDHILNNINIFMNYNCALYSPPLYGYVITANHSECLDLPLNTKISLFGIPEATISSQGLNWELHNYAMTFPGRNSSLNRTNQQTIKLEVHTGNVLVLIHCAA